MQLLKLESKGNAKITADFNCLKNQNVRHEKWQPFGQNRYDTDKFCAITETTIKQERPHTLTHRKYLKNFELIACVTLGGWSGSCAYPPLKNMYSL